MFPLLLDADSGRRGGWDDAGIGLPHSRVSVKYISDHQVTLITKRLWRSESFKRVSVQLGAKSVSSFSLCGIYKHGLVVPQRLAYKTTPAYKTYKFKGVLHVK